MDFSARDAAQAVCGAVWEGRGLRTPLPRESVVGFYMSKKEDTW